MVMAVQMDMKVISEVMCHHTAGYQCGDCTVGYYRRDSRCVECDSFADLVLFMAFVLIFIALTLLLWINYKPVAQTRFAAIRVGWSFVQVCCL